MRIIRFESAGRVHLGQVLGEDYSSALRIEGDLFGEYRVTGERLAVDKLLAPLVPTDILCIGLNYREHAKESNSAIPENPMLFIKASNTLSNPGDAILIPKRSSQIDKRAGWGGVLGRRGSTCRGGRRLV
jgi:2-keto-4-pentenoate hydratase/2-oxohepta-3-ene-1,7-dioic acid hydratase in catechol pathway